MTIRKKILLFVLFFMVIPFTCFSNSTRAQSYSQIEIDPKDDPQRWINIFFDYLNPQNTPQRFKPDTNHADVNWSIMRWKESLHSAPWAKERFADHACLIRVEDLVNKPEPIMSHLAEFLGLQYDHSLLIPTFNSYPISDDSSFTKAEGDGNTGNSNANLTLDKNKLKIIGDLTSDDYQAALHEVVSF